MTEQTQSLITQAVIWIVANWAVLLPMMKAAIKFTWEKSLQWNKLLTDISTLQTTVETLQKDLNEAHRMIRELKGKTNGFTSNNS